MGRRERKQILVVLAVAMTFGIAVYLKLWTIDYTFTTNDTELLRRQFDLAYRKAMDDSAEWRLRFDEEAEKASKCAMEIEEVTRSLGVESTNASSFKLGLAMLQKEKASLDFLLKQVETLKGELEAAKSKCPSQ